MTVRRIGSDGEAQALAARLTSRERDRPAVVLTIAGGHREPFGDAEQICAAVGDLAEVVIMPTTSVSRAFSDAMPPATQVYGGAGRVYPVGHEWIIYPERSRLRFAYSVADRDRITEHLINDALGAAMAGDVPRLRSRPSQRQRSGTVLFVVQSRAIVTLDDGTPATVWEELTEHGVPLDRVLAVKQQVTGMYDPESRRLDLRTGLRRTGPTGYRAGDVVLADVAAVSPDAVDLRLLPGVAVRVERSAVTSNESDALTGLFTVGEVVTGRVSATEPLTLRLDDVDDDEEPKPAPSLLPGGPPWLRLPEPVTPVETAEPAPARTPKPIPVARQPVPARRPSPLDLVRKGTPDAVRRKPAVGLTDELLAERARTAALATELEALRIHAAGLRCELDQAARGIERLQSRYRKAERDRQKATRHKHAGLAFPDPADQFRHEVYCEWAQRIPAAEKVDRPLGPFDLGPDFLDSVGHLEGVQRNKIVAVVVEVVTGIAERSPGRDAHRLRSGDAGSPYLTRPDGANCWRVALQRETPAARRLHYWRRGDHYELSRVVQHDDFRP